MKLHVPSLLDLSNFVTVLQKNPFGSLCLLLLVAAFVAVIYVARH